MAETVERWGGIDLVLNNASAINLAPMRDLEVKRFDLMQQINARGTFVVTRACLPHLRESDHAHVLTLSPPLSVDPRWLRGHSAYTLSKMGMTMITLGVAADEAEAGVGANCLWPRTIIATAAVQNLLGGDEAMSARPRARDRGRRRAEILSRDPRECTGNVFIDDEVLAEAGVDRPGQVRRHAGRRARDRHLRRGLVGVGAVDAAKSPPTVSISARSRSTSMQRPSEKERRMRVMVMVKGNDDDRGGHAPRHRDAQRDGEVQRGAREGGHHARRRGAPPQLEGRADPVLAATSATWSTARSPRRRS